MDNVGSVAELYSKDECFRKGFLLASQSFNPKDLDMDLTGKSFMITGANTGIGKSATLELAKRGGEIHMLCQDSDEPTRTEIVEKSGNKNVHLHVLDLSEPRRVYEFAKRFAETWKSLTVLVNNAACIDYMREVTGDGWEKNFAVNTMGVYLLTTTLLPLLSKTPGSRVIMVSTVGVYSEKLSLEGLTDLKREGLKPFDGHKCYAQSKRQQLVMMKTWARMYPAVQFSAMRTGIADTPLLKSFLPSVQYEKSKSMDKLRTPEEGADTIVWLGISKDAMQQANGEFFMDRKIIPFHLFETKSTEEEEQQVMKILDEMASHVINGGHS